jgi:hypothetical protein
MNNLPPIDKWEDHPVYLREAPVSNINSSSSNHLRLASEFVIENDVFVGKGLLLVSDGKNSVPNYFRYFLLFL